jgi:hypothetical protein
MPGYKRALLRTQIRFDSVLSRIVTLRRCLLLPASSLSDVPTVSKTSYPHFDWITSPGDTGIACCALFFTFSDSMAYPTHATGASSLFVRLTNTQSRTTSPNLLANPRRSSYSTDPMDRASEAPLLSFRDRTSVARPQRSLMA